ncbi:DUF4369 domain-containing protein [Bacteroides sp.]|uniref:DUF4369 domain-containing protein n=1 Tax=Bacteroides sp. TaxID=29523 RepID=UPI001B7B1D97|nr:DUF4369 domain-containing protein [Bacteroides sp.]MBP8622943.1 DUF4369 domain-containing protein [Bacteroides sp.]
MDRLFPLFLLLGVFTSCTPKYEIEGCTSLSSLDGRMLYIKTLNNGNWEKVDSAEVIHGSFCMKGVVDSVMMVNLYMDEANIMPLVLEKGKLKIIINNTELKASGTPLNDAFYDFVEKKNAMDMELSELERKEARMVLEGADLADIHEQLAKESRVLVEKTNKFVHQFIADNYENVLGSGVFMMICSGLPYPILTPQIEAILKDAPDSFKNHQVVKEFTTKAKQNQQLIEEHQRLEQSSAMR